MEYMSSCFIFYVKRNDSTSFTLIFLEIIMVTESYQERVPPRSYDLAQLDYFLWGYQNSVIHAKRKPYFFSVIGVIKLSMLKKCRLTDRWPATSCGEVTIHIDNKEAKLTLSSLNVHSRPKFIIKGIESLHNKISMDDRARIKLTAVRSFWSKGIVKNLMSPPPLAR